MIFTEGDPLSGMSAAFDAGERLLFPASICPKRPASGVKLYLGKDGILEDMFSGLQGDLEIQRKPGLLFTYSYGKTYPNIGAIQVSLKFPFLLSNQLLRDSVQHIALTLGSYKKTHVFFPMDLGFSTAKPIFEACPQLDDRLMVWTGGY